MTSHNEPVQPTPFEVANSEASSTGQPQSHPSATTWVLPGLAILLALVVLVVFWLPGKFDLVPSDNAAPTIIVESKGPDDRTITPTPTEAAPPKTAAEDVAPWSDAQQARLRLAAQDVLADLLDLQFNLEEQGVKRWAPGAFADAAAVAGEGDVLYRQQAYADAAEQYQQSLSHLRKLFDGLPQRLQMALDAGEEGIENGDIALASASLQTAGAIEPENDELTALQQRLQQLPEVLKLLASARKSEAAAELETAADSLRRASTLDPLHRGTAQALDRVQAALREQNFQASMSAGYAHLGTGEFGQARASFTRADKLKPQSAEAASALREVAAASTVATLADLQRQGTAQQAKEAWQDAVDTYERALKIDPNILYAATGLSRSRERARLDKDLRKILSAPKRLGEKSVTATASDLLRYARKVKPQGKLLLSQISALDTLLQRAKTPVAVTLRSDSATEVVVLKVARLGKFSQHEIALRPGNYTAVGTRVGYRDVRRKFTVDLNGNVQEVTIMCTEQI